MRNGSSKKILRGADDSIYHYTTIEGLLGILTTSKIWLTCINFLNDTTEFSLHQYACQSIERKLAKSNSESETKFLKAVRTELGVKNFIPPFVACFSKKTGGDDLNQWRGYGGDGPSFCIEFSRSALIKSAPKNADILDCEYDESTSRFFADLHIESRAELYTRTPDQKTKTKEIWRCINDIYTIAVTHKDKAFADEQEVRLVFYPRLYSEDFKKIEYRKRGNSIIPYIKHEIKIAGKRGISGIMRSVDADQRAIQSIRIGPTFNTHSIEKAFDIIKLATIGQGVEIINSGVPYRNW